jgi:hypothetical protein
LLDALEDGPRPRAELVAAAAALGISESALSTAKRRLGVEHRREGPSRAATWGETTWQLPGWREGE